MNNEFERFFTFHIPRTGVPGVGHKSEVGRGRRREAGNGKDLGCPERNFAYKQSPHRLMLFNDSVVVVSLRSAKDATKCRQDVDWGVAQVQDQVGGDPQRPGGAGAVGRDGHVEFSASEEQVVTSEAEAGAAKLALRGTGAWLRLQGASAAHALLLQDGDHRWWITEMQVSDIQHVVSSNVIAAAYLECAVALQHVAQAATMHKSALFDDISRSPDRGKGERNLQPRGPPSWVKFRNIEDKARFMRAVARLQAAPHGRGDEENGT